ncbi:MAG: TRCF domain-containing protein, partial [Marinoscillum sp.]
MGFDVYHKILDEAVGELKETEFKDLFENDQDRNKFHAIKEECVIETDLEILIPQDYVSNISERLNLYSKMDTLETPVELDAFIKGMRDRFGPLPETVNRLMISVQVRWVGIALGFEKISIKNELMKCYLSESKDEAYFQSDLFGHVLQFVQSQPRRCNMRDHRKKLIISITEINGVEEALSVLNQMYSTVPA